jgi:hypothetical protein
MNLGLIAPGPGDGTSFYRAFGPLSYLSRETGIRLITADDWDWTNLLQLDAMFLQRPYTNEHGMIAKLCRALCIPLWVDYDDLYSAFPAWAPRQRVIYGNAEALRVMQFCLETAAVVTVSTEVLRQKLSPKAIVVPNALNTYLWPFSTAPRRKVITWRGSGGHVGDLDPHIETIRAIAAEFPEWEFHWLGAPHFKCFDIGQVHPYRDLFSFMETFHGLAPSIHIVPLADCCFNRCKSNIAWLEAAAAGAVTVAPNYPEWQRPGVINYADDATFECTLRGAIIASDADRSAALAQSREFIHEHLRLSVVNQQRIDILKGLTRGGKG